MRMTEDQLVGLRVTHVSDIEIICLRTDLCIEQHVHQHVPQLLANPLGIVLHQGVAQFEGLLYRIGPQTLIGLFLIPRTFLPQLVQHIQ